MKTANPVTRVDIEGELSIFTAASLRERLLEALREGAEVEVDLSNVAEIDTAGVQLMLAARREAGVRHASLRFVGHSPAVAGVLDLFELSGDFGDSVPLRRA